MASASRKPDGRCEYCGTWEGDRRCTACGAPKAPPAFNVIDNFGFPPFPDLDALMRSALSGEPGTTIRYRPARTWLDDDPVFGKLVKRRTR